MNLLRITGSTLRRRKLDSLAGIASLALLACPAMAMAQTDPVQPRADVSSDGKLDQRAIDALRNMSVFLGNLKEFQLTADAFFNLDGGEGETIQLHSVSKYEAIMPNKLAVTTRNAMVNEIDVFDGQTLTIYLPDKGVYVDIPYRGNVSNMLLAAKKELGVDFPVQHLFRWGTETSWLGKPIQARVIGEDSIDGWPTIHYAIRLETFDFQVWLDTGPYAVPRRIVVTEKGELEGGGQRYAANLTWNLSPDLDDSDFSLESRTGNAAGKLRKVSLEEANTLSIDAN